MKFYKFISYIFHPVLVPIVSTLLYFIVIPNQFTKEFVYQLLIIIFATTYIVPILMLSLLKKLNLIENYHLSSIDERKFPILFFASLTTGLGIFILKSNIINLLAFSYFGGTLALVIVYLLLFGKIKASLHTLGVSGLTGFITIISYEYKLNLLVLLILLFLLFGLVATSRLKLKAHKMSEVFLGFIVGFFTQILVYLLYTFQSI